MDYEKKYKDALANARQEYTTTENVERKRWLEELFPELKESEDEKIRKRVLFSLQKDFMTTKNSGCSTKDLEDCIAWLEKQGESYTKNDVNDAYLKGISEAKNELEKQGEQKPAAWSKDDEAMFQSCTGKYAY